MGVVVVVGFRAGVSHLQPVAFQVGERQAAGADEDAGGAAMAWFGEVCQLVRTSAPLRHSCRIR